MVVGEKIQENQNDVKSESPRPLNSLHMVKENDNADWKLSENFSLPLVARMSVFWRSKWQYRWATINTP